jgi:hypothetical protein
VSDQARTTTGLAPCTVKTSLPPASDHPVAPRNGQGALVTTKTSGGQQRESPAWASQVSPYRLTSSRRAAGSSTPGHNAGEERYAATVRPSGHALVSPASGGFPLEPGSPPAKGETPAGKTSRRNSKGVTHDGLPSPPPMKTGVDGTIGAKLPVWEVGCSLVP